MAGRLPTTPELPGRPALPVMLADGGEALAHLAPLREDRPGSCPIPRGHSRRSASAKAPVRPVASARSGSRRDPAWLTTPHPAAETTSRGRDLAVCPPKVPSYWADRDSGQSLIVPGQKAPSLFRS